MSECSPDVARRELAHALEALDDGAGHEEWGPGLVLVRLDSRNMLASEALQCAIMSTHDLLMRTSRPGVIRALRVLAPVFLELIIEGPMWRSDVCATCHLKPCHPLCASVLR